MNAVSLERVRENSMAYGKNGDLFIMPKHKLNKIIFFASSYKIGLTGQLSEQACVVNKYAPDRFLFITGEKQQFPGLFEKLTKHKLNYSIINGLDEHKELTRLVREFKKHINHFNPQIVHVRTNWQLLIVVLTKILFGYSYSILYTIHGYRHNLRFRSVIAKYLIGLALYLFADYIVTPSHFLNRQFSFLRGKRVTIPIGEDDAFFGEYSVPSFAGTKIFVFPGEFRAGKNQDLLIRALRHYIDISGNDDVELYLPGKGDNLETCKALSKELGLEKRIFFPGFLNREQMQKLYLKCQFALIPSNVETFGHCIVEPFIMGRVVITRHVGVADDIIMPGETGFFFNNEEDLVQVLLSVVADEVLCETVARNAFNQRDQFRWDSICKQYFDLIYNKA